MSIQEMISSGLLERYAMGTASAAESRDVEGWVKQYPEVAAELAAIELVLEQYARANAITPASSVKENIFKKIQNRSAAPVVNIQSATNIKKMGTGWKFAAAASIALLMGSIVFNFTYYNKYKSTTNDLQTAQSALKKQNELANAMKDDMGKMSDPNAMPVTLKGKDGAARIYWMENSGDLYIDPSNLPAMPDSLQYQLWAIVDGKPVSGGMISFTKDGSTVHLQKMKSFGKVEAFAVSIEKAGPESQTPTKVYVISKI